VSALKSLSSSSMFAENFTLKPKICGSQEKDYSTPTTRDWWHYMQTSIYTPALY